MPVTNQKSQHAAIAEIARTVLRIETLETRNRDQLDFHDRAVWTIREALERAYTAGHEAATFRSKNGPAARD